VICGENNVCVTNKDWGTKNLTFSVFMANTYFQTSDTHNIRVPPYFCTTYWLSWL